MEMIKKIKEHYLMNWGKYSKCIFNKERVHEVLPMFNVLKFKPNKKEIHGFMRLVECQRKI